MQLVFPTSGRAEILGRPARRPRRPPSHRLPARASLLLRLPDRRGAAHVFRRSVRLRGRRPARARRTAARRGGHRRRAAAAAAAVLEGDAAAGRHRAGADQRPRAGHPRRADVGARSARPPRRARSSSCGCAISGCTVFFSSHVLSDAEALCSRVAILAARPAGGRRPAERARGASRRAGWELVVADARRRAAGAAPRRGSLRAMRIGARTLRARAAARRRRPNGSLADLAAAGARLVSLNPIRDTLEDFFVQQVSGARRARRPAAGREERRQRGPRVVGMIARQRVPRVGARQGALQPRGLRACC